MWDAWVVSSGDASGLTVLILAVSILSVMGFSALETDDVLTDGSCCVRMNSITRMYWMYVGRLGMGAMVMPESVDVVVRISSCMLDEELAVMSDDDGVRLHVFGDGTRGGGGGSRERFCDDFISSVMLCTARSSE